MPPTTFASRAELALLNPVQGASIVTAGRMCRVFVELRIARIFIRWLSSYVSPPFLRKLPRNKFFIVVPHTPCLAWPNCSRGPLCSYKHPEPLIPKVPEIQSPPPPPPQHAQPPSPVRVIPTGTVQFHGTTYFPVGSPTAPPGPNIPSPHYTWNYSPGMPSVASGYSPYSPESLPFHSPYYEAVSNLPPASSIPRVFASADLDDIHRLAGMPSSTLPPIPGPSMEPSSSENPVKSDTNTTEGHAESFPYQPPPPGEQQQGHARRVSVVMKSKEDTDALGLTLPRTTRRESWMGHRQRDDPAHRVSEPWHASAAWLFDH